MSGYILCQTKKAENPYFIENIGLNIYSIEELCYYFSTDLPLLDHTILNRQLVQWLWQELNLKTLAQKLAPLPDREFSVGEFIFPVLKEINYLNQQEFRRLEEALKKLEQEPAPVRAKRKGDALMAHKKYTKAIKAYEKILRKDEKGRMGIQLAGNIYHNMGCAYARLFQMDEACACFRKAYEILHTKDALMTCLYGVYLKDVEEAYARLAEEFRVDAGTRQEADRRIFGIVPMELPENLDKALADWTGEYHRNTGVGA